MSNNKILVALSGGVDSSVAAIMLKEQGYDLIGITLRMYKSQFRSDPLEQSINDATILAGKLGIPYYVIDVSDEFEKTIIHNFIDEYQSGRTPNPCSLCNYRIKWKYLVELADEFGCDYIATGHYAQIKELKGRYYISKGVDGVKDQSYFLWRLSQDYLKRTMFPLGHYPKSEIKQIAEEEGFKIIAGKKESYDVCFIPEGDYRDFIQQNHQLTSIKPKKGYFVSTNGEILGEHKGIYNYTIGQRKGLGIAYSEPLYVTKIDVEDNLIVLGTENDLKSKVFYLETYNMSKYGHIPENTTVKIKIRYKSPEIEGKLSFVDDKLKVEPTKPISAITPGQSAVFYEGDDLIGGGVIR
ncbi:MAG: tRNA 2-thiouridine(34) synthase MnmA [Bacteroidota bacterium]